MKYTVKQFRKDFPNDDACLDKIMSIRVGESPTCPKCRKVTKFHRVTGRRQYACQYCGHQIAPCAGTVFEKSPTPLSDWFYAMYLFTSTRHGVPAKELERQLGVTYKTAWRMAHQLRKLMAQADSGDKCFGGHVEIDETFVGGFSHRPGKARGGDPSRGKATVLGITERGGEIKTYVVPNRSRNTLEPLIEQHVPWGATVSTDELPAYKYLDATPGEHGVVRHMHHEYVNGIHHTNSIEGYWGRFKNSVRGTHVHISPKHTPKYLAEFDYRYNNRKVGAAAMFDRLLSGML